MSSSLSTSQRRTNAAIGGSLPPRGRFSVQSNATPSSKSAYSPTGAQVSSRAAEVISDQVYNMMMAKLKAAEGNLMHIPEEYKKDQFDVIKELGNILNGDMDRLESQLNTRLGQMNEAMSGIVDGFYQGFNKCLTNFSGIATHTKDSLEQVNDLKDKVMKVQELMSKHSRDLNMLKSRAQQYKYMIEIIDKIQVIIPTQDMVSKYTENRHYLHAVYLINKTTRQLFEDEFVGVRSLDQLRDELIRLKPTYDERIIQELSDFIYLRRHASVKSISAVQSSNDEDAQDGAIVDVDELGKIERYSKIPVSEEVWEDSSKAVESDIPLFVKNLIESLHILNRIPTFHSQLVGNIVSELHEIVRMLAKDVLARHGPVLRTTTAAVSTRRSQRKHPQPLIDLLNQLYYRFSSILENHAYIIKVLSQDHIKKRMIEFQEKPTKSPTLISLLYESSTTPISSLSRPRTRTMRTREALARQEHEINVYPLMTVWVAMQQELERLLAGHLNPAEPANEPKKDLRRPSQIGDSVGLEKAITPIVFKFSNAIAKEERDLQKEDTQIVVCEKSIYHILHIYRSLIVFSDHGNKMASEFRVKLARGNEPKDAQLRRYLDNFLTEKFFPRLSEDCKAAVTKIFSGDEAFKPMEKKRSHGKSNDHSRSLMKACVEIIELVEELVADSVYIPVFISEFISVIETILSKFHEKCLSFYHDLVGRCYVVDQLKVSTYFSMLQNHPLRPRSNMGEAWTATQYEEAEYKYEERLYNKMSLNADQILVDSSVLNALGILCDSMEWMTERIEMIGTGSAMSKSGSVRTKTLGSQSLTTNRQLMFKSFEPLALKFYNLSERCLFTIRVELRCQCFYYMNGIKSAFYVLEDEPAEPDVFVLDLSKVILLMEELMAVVLPEDKRKYIFSGLGKLCSTLLIKGLPKIASINQNGVIKMLRNINALHQSFSSLVYSKVEDFVLLSHICHIFIVC
eukprot:TRINITY_DN4545_c0_g1_i1.p1 TRINITY_DN4545_c0_g1~~TRINITY_DN4545_c0_g1_i1.p1  ORF type:complete len:966 (+),score=184.81 TRINITY_DN4545_c0_g1_i1:51-2948(+)